MYDYDSEIDIKEKQQRVRKIIIMDAVDHATRTKDEDGCTRPIRIKSN